MQLPSSPPGDLTRPQAMKRAGISSEGLHWSLVRIITLLPAPPKTKGTEAKEPERTCKIKVGPSKAISDLLTVLRVGKQQDLGCHLSNAPAVCGAFVFATLPRGTEGLCGHEGLSLREPQALVQAKICPTPMAFDGS